MVLQVNGVSNVCVFSRSLFKVQILIWNVNFRHFVKSSGEKDV